MRREEAVHALNLRLKEGQIRNQDEKNRSLAIANFQKESRFAVEMVEACRDFSITTEQINMIISWISSREAPVRELVALKQILAVEEKGKDQ